MRILILGSGAREHAILRALEKEVETHQIYVASGNAGMAAHQVEVDPMDAKAVIEFARVQQIELVVVGPEAPLAAGVADEVRAVDIPVFGPNKDAAQLESSKAFAKEVMTSAGVPTAQAIEAFTSQEVAEALDKFGTPYVVKADGLASGKGVLVTSDRAAAMAHAEKYLTSGPVLVEEFLAGREVSLFVVTDGVNAYPLTPAQDYKRIGDGDTGPNTGGMGSYSPLNWLPDGFSEEVMRTVALPTLKELDRRGSRFNGLLYCGLIVTEKGIRVIEFNVRFGDPETQVVLERLDSPLSDLLFAAATGRLETVPAPTFSDECAVCVVIASEGYPASPIAGRKIQGLENVSDENVTILHAATVHGGSDLFATGGRVLSVVGTGRNFGEARDRVYHAIDKIKLDGAQFRTDIAATEV